MQEIAETIFGAPEQHKSSESTDNQQPTENK
jgi:hypothetical protein